MAGPIKIAILANARQATKELDGFRGKLAGLGKVAGAAVVGAAAAGAVAAGAFAVKAVKSASDLNETLNKSQVIFGTSAAGMEQWANTAYKTVGLSKEAALGATASFGDMFQQIGLSQKEAVKLSKGTVQLAADLGSFNNLDTADVMDRISAAYRGEYDSLQAVIPNINAARVEQEALALTHKKSAKELTAADKALAVNAILNKDGARAIGDFAKTSDGAANKQKILAAQFENVSARLGTLLLPAFSALLTVVGKVLDFIDARVVPAFEKFAASEKAAGFMDKLRAAFSTISEVITGTVVPILLTLWDAFQQKVLPAMQAVWRVVLDDLIPAVGGLLAALAPIVAWLVQKLAPIFASVWQGILLVVKGALKIISGIINVVTAVITGDWSRAWTGIKQILSGAWNVIVGILKTAWALVKGVFKLGVDAVIEIAGTIVGRIKSVIGSAKDKLVSIGSDLIEGLKRGFSNAWDGFKRYVSGKVDDFVASVKSKLKIFSPSRVFRTIGDQTGQGFRLGFKDKMEKAITDAKKYAGDVTKAASAETRGTIGLGSLTTSAAGGSSVPAATLVYNPPPGDELGRAIIDHVMRYIEIRGGDVQKVLGARA